MARLTCPATMDNFQRLMDFVSDESRAAGFGDAETGKIELAFEEAVVNVINYAYVDGTGDVTVECTAPPGGKGLRISISDAGVPFDPLAKEDPDITADAADRPIGGLGIFMVKKTMDEVAYERTDDGHNVLTMTRLPGDGTA